MKLQHVATRFSACLALTFALLTTSCGSSGGSQGGSDAAHMPAGGSVVEASAGRTAAVVGTVLDASTRKPLAGALVVGPGGLQAKSGASGRFELEGFPAGTQGELRVSTAGGLSGAVKLRPLAVGAPLEVVIHVR